MSYFDTIRKIFTRVIIITCFAWCILPILILNENYVFTINDGLDSYAAMVQNIYDNDMYFRLNEKMPYMNGLEGKYTMLSYTIYDFLNCTFGYLYGQILTRILSVCFGFFSVRLLLKNMFSIEGEYSNDILLLICMIYAMTPIAPNRMLAYSTLPLLVLFFRELYTKNEFSSYVFIGLILPLLSSFQAVFIFVLGIWFFASIVVYIYTKKININLLFAFIEMLIVTIVTNLQTLSIAMSSGETNRSLYFSKEIGNFDINLFIKYLMNGQYHSSFMHNEIILPVLFFGTLYLLVWFMIKGECRQSLIFIVFGWLFWILSAFIRTFQEGGFRTGLLVIDGYQWGESIALMRIVWVVMLTALLFSINNVYLKNILYIAMICQIYNVITYKEMYNENMYSVQNAYYLMIKRDSKYITFREFFEPKLFKKIKDDIHYHGEGVIAYGYHPSVLLFNNFNTIDGYFSVHSMKWQNEFREIISPALDRYDNYRNYYDGWGGRMYIFGDINYESTKIKNRTLAPLYINTKALKKFGGNYIISAAEISNTKELNIRLLNDYSLTNSIYHMYVYQVE